MLEAAVGIHRDRVLPSYAAEPLARRIARRPTVERAGEKPGKKVALFADTYARFHEPQIGVAAVELLEACGYQVVLAEAGCCQRPRTARSPSQG